MGGRGSSYYTKKQTEGVMSAMRDAGLPPAVSTKEAQKILNRDFTKNRVSRVVDLGKFDNYEKQYTSTATESSKKAFNTEKDNIMKRIASNPSGAKTYIQNKQKSYDSQISQIHKEMKKPGITEKEYQKLLNKSNNLTAKRTATYLINSSTK